VDIDLRAMHHPNVVEIFVILTLILIIREVRVVWNIVGGSYMGRWCKRMPVPVNRVARLGSAAMAESLEAVAVARPRVHIHDVHAVADGEGDWLDLGGVQRRHVREALAGSVVVADATLAVKGQDASPAALAKGHEIHVICHGVVVRFRARFAEGHGGGRKAKILHC
jgi:hypothetical protein